MPVTLPDRITAELTTELSADLDALQAESMGWQRLETGAYLHCGAPEATVIEVVGVARASMANSQVLWLTGEL